VRTESRSARSSCRGFTFLEMVATAGILMILASAILPMARITRTRQREIELRRELRTMRTAIDKFKDSCGPYAWAAIPYIQRLLGLAREAGSPVFFTHGVPVAPAGPGGGPDRGTSIVDELKPAPGEVVIEKAVPSAFFGTHLIRHLVGARVDTVIVTGCTTSGCVRATVIDSYSYRFHTVVPIEAVFDRAETPHRFVAEAQSPGRPGAKVLEEDVRPGDEPAEDSAATRVFEVEHHAALVRVHPEMGRALTAHRAVPVAHHVAARRLDLDDLRAEVGQVAEPQRTANRHPQRDDAHPIERKHHTTPQNPSGFSRAIITPHHWSGPSRPL